MLSPYLNIGWLRITALTIAVTRLHSNTWQFLLKGLQRKADQGKVGEYMRCVCVRWCVRVL